MEVKKGQLTSEANKGLGRMDSHISKGNKKRTKQVTEKKKLYIFEKYLQSSFFPPIRF
jgi:hypothetical protein